MKESLSMDLLLLPMPQLPTMLLLLTQLPTMLFSATMLSLLTQLLMLLLTQSSMVKKIVQPLIIYQHIYYGIENENDT